MADPSDPFAASRLPDLPTAGYATLKERAITDGIMFFIRDIERDRLQLLDIVCSGREKFRHVLSQEWRYLGDAVDTDLKDAIFGYLVLLAGENPGQQRDQLLQMKWTPAPRTKREEEQRVRRNLEIVTAINRGQWRAH